MSLASFSSDSFTPDRLVVKGDIEGKAVTVLSGQSVVRGEVMGKITKGAASVDASGNTGDGEIAAVTLGDKAKVGDYLVTCHTAADGAAVFSVVDPDGERLGDAVEAVAYSNEHLVFTITDADTEFVAGDKFTITVAAGSGKYKASAAAATDGSQNPVGIMANPCDASLADTEGLLYDRGEFLGDALTLGAGHTVASVKAAFLPLDIHIHEAVG